MTLVWWICWGLSRPKQSFATQAQGLLHQHSALENAAGMQEKWFAFTANVI